MANKPGDTKGRRKRIDFPRPLKYNDILSSKGEKKAMHWADKLAQEIVLRNPDKDEYVCAAGISPSGSIHIGNFRDIATSLFVCKSLEKMGKKARLLFSWDEFDRLRKVPRNVSAVVGDAFEKYIGYPYVDVPDPFGDCHANYAVHFEQEFLDSMKEFGIEMDYKYQAAMYRDGVYREEILHALKMRREIFDILDSFRTQDADEGERENYYPASIFCTACKRDTTKILDYDDDTHLAHYACECGYNDAFDFNKNTNCKLAWKTDWAMRWMYEKLDFEPAGKDHASPTGSRATSKRICEEIYHYPAPAFQGYEFIGIKGSTGKMSGSSGLNLTPATLLKVYQPELILWLYSRTEPLKAFDFCFDEGILRHYAEFDKQYAEYMAGEPSERVYDIISNCIIPGRVLELVPMNLLVQLGPMVDFRPDRLEELFARLGLNYRREQFAERLEKAKFWLYNCSPESVLHLRATRNWEAFNALGEEVRAQIKMLFDYIGAGGYTLDELNNTLYDIPKRTNGAADEKELKAAQRNFFTAVYNLLIDKDTGPRLYQFLYAIDAERYLGLLDFSYPKTGREAEAEAAAELAAQAELEREEVPAAREADPVEPIKPEIDIADFEKLDLRVCRVVKCSEMRKLNKGMKLVLFDGIKERTIVSTIRDEYEPEQLVGKKIIVVANLAPRRLGGATSEGMLLAGTNGACGCRVVFVDDAIPEGTQIR